MVVVLGPEVPPMAYHQGDPDSDLYAESPGAATVMGYITTHSDPPARCTHEATAVPESAGLPDEMVGTPWNSADGPRWRTSALAPSSSRMTQSTGPPANTSRPRPEPCCTASEADHEGNP